MKKLLLLMAMLITAGCAGTISSESLKLVDPAVSYKGVKAEPDRYQGKHILVGGMIAKIRNSDAGAEFEIVQFPLKGNYHPDTTAMSEGRFIAASTSFAEPTVFRPGSLVSVVGVVQGEKTQQLDAVQYRYPVIGIKEMYVWKPDDIRLAPRFHFGLGLGFGHRF